MLISGSALLSGSGSGSGSYTAVHRLGVINPLRVEVLRVMGIIYATAVVATLQRSGSSSRSDSLLIRVAVKPRAAEAMRREVEGVGLEMEVTTRRQRSQAPVGLKYFYLVRNGIRYLSFVRLHHFDKVYHRIENGHANHSKFRYIV